MIDSEQSAVATLSELLPGLEREPDHWADRALTARMWCALRGWTLLSLDRMSDDIRVIAETPDGTVTDPVVVPPVLTSLDAADDLVREVLPGFCYRLTDVFADGSAYCCISIPKDENYSYFYEGKHPTDEPRAILAALVRARIAETQND